VTFLSELLGLERRHSRVHGCCSRRCTVRRSWAQSRWNLAEAVIVLGSLATVITKKGETREVGYSLQTLSSDSDVSPAICK